MSILKAKDGEFVISFGMECGTWVTVSRYSTKREYFSPLGDTSRKCVADANLLCSRTDSSGMVSSSLHSEPVFHVVAVMQSVCQG